MDSLIFERYYFKETTFWMKKKSLKGYVDFYLAGDIDSKRSTIGYVFTIGGTVVSWISRLQRLLHFQPLKLSMLLLWKLARR
jgi:hypothetical protein